MWRRGGGRRDEAGWCPVATPLHACVKSLVSLESNGDPLRGFMQESGMCFRKFILAAEWVMGWEDILAIKSHGTPGRDHELPGQGNGDRTGGDGLGKRCEGGKAECGELWGREGLAPSLTKCVTLSKRFNPNFSLR